MRSTTANRDLVHDALWERCDRRGKLLLVQKELAREVGLSVFVMCRVVADLEDDGRIKKIASRYLNVGVYVVKDPADFSEGP